MNQDGAQVEIKWPRAYTTKVLNDVRQKSVEIGKSILNAARYGEHITSIFFPVINPLETQGLRDTLVSKGCKVELIKHSSKSVTFVINFKNMILFKEGEES